MSYKFNRRDSNHDRIVSELLSAGWQVFQVYTLKGANNRASAGLFDSCGDMIAVKVGESGRVCSVWIEAKSGVKSERELTNAEEKFYNYFCGHVIIANDNNNAVELCESFRKLY